MKNFIIGFELLNVKSSTLRSEISKELKDIYKNNKKLNNSFGIYVNNEVLELVITEKDNSKSSYFFFVVLFEEVEEILPEERSKYSKSDLEELEIDADIYLSYILGKYEPVLEIWHELLKNKKPDFAKLVKPAMTHLSQIGKS